MSRYVIEDESSTAGSIEERELPRYLLTPQRDAVLPTIRFDWNRGSVWLTSTKENENN